MRGRRSKPDDVKRLTGNPGKRKLAPAAAHESLPPGAAPDQAPAAPPSAASDFNVAEYLSHAREKAIFHRVFDDYLRRRVARREDVFEYVRWAHYAHVWLQSKEDIAANGGSRAYIVKSKHGEYVRPHPSWRQQLECERALQTLEDRLGLNPVSRQNILRGLAALPAALGGLFDEPESKPPQGDKPAAEPPPQNSQSPLGALANVPMPPNAKPN